MKQFCQASILLNHFFSAFLANSQLGQDPSTCTLNDKGHPYCAKFTQVSSLQGMKMERIACGGEHSAAIAEDGALYTWGDDSCGQLAHKNQLSEVYNNDDARSHFNPEPTLQQGVMDIALGSSVSFIITATKKTISIQQHHRRIVNEKAVIDTNVTDCCWRCTKQICTLCGQTSHDGKCESMHESKIIAMAKENKKWTRCTKCGYVLERIDGCDHMTCKCGAQFCFQCGSMPHCGSTCKKK